MQNQNELLGRAEDFADQVRGTGPIPSGFPGGFWGDSGPGKKGNEGFGAGSLAWASHPSLFFDRWTQLTCFAELEGAPRPNPEAEMRLFRGSLPWCRLISRCKV